MNVLGKEWYLIKMSLILLNVFHYSFYFIIYQTILKSKILMNNIVIIGYFTFFPLISF